LLLLGLTTESLTGAMRKYLSARRQVLEPVLSHFVEAAGIGLIVRGTSTALKYMLPADFHPAIYQIELIFYAAIFSSLSVYTFLVFCFVLAIELLSKVRTETGKFFEYREHSQLAPRSQTETIPEFEEQRDKVS
jgi:hypothetical protein